jgi:hypothetical protein
VLIKILLIAAVLGVGAVLIRGHGARRQALRRLGLVVFALVAVASIIEPDALTWVARKINVGRGADLLLYILIVVFFSYVATRYVKDARTQDQITAIARRVALDQAPPPRSVVNSHAPAGRAVSGTLTSEDTEGKQSLGPRRPDLHRPPRGGGPEAGGGAGGTSSDAQDPGETGG